MIRAALSMLLICAAILLPAGILRVHAAAGTLADLRSQRASLDSSISDVRAWLAQYPASQRAYEQRRARKLGISEATASFPVIQGRFTAFIDTLAREERIRVGSPSTCNQSPQATARAGLTGLQCTLTFTGPFIAQLDTLRRISAQAPVLVDATAVQLQRNNAADLSPNPILAATVTVYLEHASPPPASPAPTSTQAPPLSPRVTPVATATPSVPTALPTATPSARSPKTPGSVIAAPDAALHSGKALPIP